MENKTKMFENQTYNRQYIIDWLKENHITQEKFAEMLDINSDTLRGYLSRNIETIPIPTLRKMARIIGVTLDFLCYNDEDPNTFDEAMQRKWWLSPEITNYLMEYKSNYYVRNFFKIDKDVNTDFNKILKLLLTKKVEYKGAKIPIIQLFNESVLTLFICTIVYDKTFMETFKQHFETLSTKINSNKTKAIGNDEIDFTFEQILEKIKDEQIYLDCTNALHNCIDKLLEITLNETFNAIKPDIKLF